MTLRLMYEGLLIELNKVEAPPFLLSDFNYFANKSVLSYINKRYNIYDTSQQTSDDLRVLKATASLSAKNPLVTLPEDYFHLLNCICEFQVVTKFKCFNVGDLITYPARRLTSDALSGILLNPYYKPEYFRPYYFINNINLSLNLPTNLYINNRGTDGELPRFINIEGYDVSVVDKEQCNRYGNSSPILMEIKYGNNSNIELTQVFIDYLKTPLYLNLTLEQLDLIEDTSLILEFPDYVCQEIINELVHLLLENLEINRLYTHIPISTSIANPTQTIEK